MARKQQPTERKLVWANLAVVHGSADYHLALHRTDGTIGCSCPGWRNRRDCKHLVDFYSMLRLTDEQIQRQTNFSIQHSKIVLLVPAALARTAVRWRTVSHRAGEIQPTLELLASLDAELAASALDKMEVAP